MNPRRYNKSEQIVVIHANTSNERKPVEVVISIFEKRPRDYFRPIEIQKIVTLFTAPDDADLIQHEQSFIELPILKT